MEPNESLFKAGHIDLVGNPSSKVKAYASIIIADAFIVKNFKILEGSKGHFVGMPSIKNSKSKNAEGDEIEFIDIAHPKKGFHEQFSKVLLDAYFEKIKAEPKNESSTAA